MTFPYFPVLFLFWLIHFHTSYQAKIHVIQCRLFYNEAGGKESIKMTLSPSLCSLGFSAFTFGNNPESNPEPDPLPNKSNTPLTSRPSTELALLTSSAGSSARRCSPQGQFVSFLKQSLWNTDSQDGHLSISSSCQ